MTSDLKHSCQSIGGPRGLPLDIISKVAQSRTSENAPLQKLPPSHPAVCARGLRARSKNVKRRLCPHVALYGPVAAFLPVIQLQGKLFMSVCFPEERTIPKVLAKCACV